MIYELMIFNEEGVLIFYDDYANIHQHSFIDRMEREKPFRDRMKTTFGLSKTLCDIVEKVSERIVTNDL